MGRKGSEAFADTTLQCLRYMVSRFFACVQEVRRCNDHQTDLLAPRRVAIAERDGTTLGDSVAHLQMGFDLLGLNVLATGEHDGGLDTARDVQKAVRVHMTEVAGVKPALVIGDTFLGPRIETITGMSWNGKT